MLPKVRPNGSSIKTRRSTRRFCLIGHVHVLCTRDFATARFQLSRAPRHGHYRSLRSLHEAVYDNHDSPAQLYSTPLASDKRQAPRSRPHRGNPNQAYRQHAAPGTRDAYNGSRLDQI